MTPEQLVLSVMDLPYLRTTTHDYGRHGLGYAIVLGGAKARVMNWCHDVDVTDPPFYYHGSETDALKCFDKNHPGLREAIEIVEKSFASARSGEVS